MRACEKNKAKNCSYLLSIPIIAALFLISCKGDFTQINEMRIIAQLYFQENLMIENFLTVSELVKEIKNIVESQFGFVVIKGEVSNIHHSFSGHTYFTLKDKESQIKCALFKFQKKAVEKELVEDHEFIVWGKLSLYEARSELTLVVSFYMPF